VVLIDGVNDSIEMAELLVQKVKRCHGCVNLIRYNAVAGAPYRPPTEVAFRRFRQALRDAGIKVTARRRRGAGVGGACGQLRLDALGKDAHG
jgi:23S rRNA (adenine2503-C2)-methyltransferase